jgi:hypothetical protein
MSIQTLRTSAPWSLVSARQDLSKFCVTWTHYFSQYWLHNLSLVQSREHFKCILQGTELQMRIGGLTSTSLIRRYDRTETNKITTQKPESWRSIMCWLLQERMYRGMYYIVQTSFSAARIDLGRSCDKGRLLPFWRCLWVTQSHDLQMNFQMDKNGADQATNTETSPSSLDYVETTHVTRSLEDRGFDWLITLVNLQVNR